jgi:hypothetical protein
MLCLTTLIFFRKYYLKITFLVGKFFIYNFTINRLKFKMC